jgi:tetratricopeptide (TPR) repeat protein
MITENNNNNNNTHESVPGNTPNPDNDYGQIMLRLVEMEDRVDEIDARTRELLESIDSDEDDDSNDDNDESEEFDYETVSTESIDSYAKCMEEEYLKIIEKDDKNAEAMYNLGILYECDYYDLIKAKKYYLMADKLNYPQAAVALGTFYMDLESFKTAIKYYLKAIEYYNNDNNCILKSSIAQVMNDLGTIYDSPYNDNRDEEKAIKYYLMAIEHGDNAALCNLAELYYEREDYKEALEYFEKYKQVSDNDNENDDECDPEEIKDYIEKCKKRINGSRKLEKLYCDIFKDNCNICTDSLIGASCGIDIFVCGHAFHKKCMNKWTKTNKETCPTCREDAE